MPLSSTHLRACPKRPCSACHDPRLSEDTLSPGGETLRLSPRKLRCFQTAPRTSLLWWGHECPAASWDGGKLNSEQDFFKFYFMMVKNIYNIKITILATFKDTVQCIEYT